MVKFLTWVDGDEPGQITTPFTTGLPVTHSSPEDIPVSVRHQILWAHQAGVPVAHLSAVYSLPQPWVELIISEEEGT